MQHQSNTPGLRASNRTLRSASPGATLLLDLTSNVMLFAFGLTRAATHTAATSALAIMGNRPTSSPCSASSLYVSTAVWGNGQRFLPPKMRLWHLPCQRTPHGCNPVSHVSACWLTGLGLGTPSRDLARTSSWNACKLVLSLIAVCDCGHLTRRTALCSKCRYHHWSANRVILLCLWQAHQVVVG